MEDNMVEKHKNLIVIYGTIVALLELAIKFTVWPASFNPAVTPVMETVFPVESSAIVWPGIGSNAGGELVSLVTATCIRPANRMRSSGPIRGFL